MKRRWFECQVCGGGKIYTKKILKEHNKMWH